MDVIGDDPADRRPPPAWLAQPPAWLARPPAWLVAVLAAVVLAAGVTAAALVEEPAPARPAVEAGPAVDLEVAAGSAGGSDLGAAGELVVVVSNARDQRVRLGRLSLEASGLRVVSVRPSFGRPLAPRERREYVVAYDVPSCAGLLLPAQLRVSFLEEGRSARSRVMLLGPGLQAVPFAACPEGSTRQVRPDLAVRSIGGTSELVGAGARGTVDLEVRNAAAPLRLLSVSAEVPGVRFSNRGSPNGITLGTDDRVEVRLGFTVDDCARLLRTGRLVLRVRQQGVEQEVGLTITTDFEAGTIRQLALDGVLEACPRRR